ncbi:MAG: YkgJ family cysteine cluster protein [Desulfobacterales bacterium]
MELNIFFDNYKKLVEAADKVFEEIKTKYPDCVTCKIECSDCCHALFDIGFVEAFYINKKFREKFKGAELDLLLEKANRTDRQVHKLKKNAYKEYKDGKDETAIIEEMAEKRIRCPMLNESDRCDIYEFRPITCRLYGVPTSIGGKGHTCGLSGFVKGQSYPTVNLDIIHNALYEISTQMIKHMGSKYTGLPEMLVPLSMALITIYDDEYLGIENEEKKDETIKEKARK